MTDRTTLDDFLDRRVWLVTGKGGVGRTVLAAACALYAARQGKRVVLTELGDVAERQSPLARIFGRDLLPEGENPMPIVDGIDGHGFGHGRLLGVRLLALTGQEQYLRTVLPSRALVRAVLASEALRRLAVAGPSLRELGIFYQLLSLVRSRRPDGSPEHELIVADMPATGHTLSLTGLPERLLHLIRSGPIHDQLIEGQSYLNDPAKTAGFTVTLPETLPISECLDLIAGLEETRVPVGAVLVNRVPVDPFTSAERAALTPLLTASTRPGATCFRRYPQSHAELARLRQSLPSTPIFEIPELLGIEGQSDRGLVERLSQLLGSREDRRPMATLSPSPLTAALSPMASPALLAPCT
ncbi:MAG: arsenic transporter [Myxococcales bacterium]|jgi:anion-transporting  ArsA/GET3 family ATPase|nr:arsenic transporter [Myxococcales bacterium]